MTPPGWLDAGFAALMILVAATSAGRLAAAHVRGRSSERDVDIVHVLMGIVMAGMFEPRLNPVPGPVCQAVFAGGAAWFAWRTLRALTRGTHARTQWTFPAAHTVECAAMIYMLRPLGSQLASGEHAGTMIGMTGPPGTAQGNPAIALVLALFMVGYIVWTADHLAGLARSSRPSRPRSSRAGTLAPRLAACYKIAMGVGMGYMLVLML